MEKEDSRSVSLSDHTLGLSLCSENKQDRAQLSIWYWYLGQGFALAPKELRPLGLRHCSLPGTFELVADVNQYSFGTQVAANHFLGFSL